MIDLWELPTSWRWTPIGDATDVIGGGTPSTTNPKNFEGSIPWITPADMSGYLGKTIAGGARFISEQGLADSGARWLPQGAVLFSSRAPIGYVAVASRPVTTNQGFKSFVPGHGLNSDYLYYWLTSAKQHAEALASGTTFLELSGAKAALIPLPLAPTAEQTRIVEKLEELLSDLDAGVAELKAAQKKLGQGLLADIETGKSFKCVERPPTLEETGVMKVSAVSWGEYDEQESKTCTVEERVNPNLLVKSGDFLFSRANTVELVGACVIAKTVNLKVMLSDKILRLVLVQDSLKPWLLYLLRSGIGRKQIENLATGNQESMKNIGQERIRSIAIPIGPEVEIDCAITLVEQGLASASRQISENEFALKQSAAQRKNILKAAFSGQLVPQDPNDEPASLLLERIRAERSEREAVKKPRGRKAKELA